MLKYSGRVTRVSLKQIEIDTQSKNLNKINVALNHTSEYKVG